MLPPKCHTCGERYDATGDWQFIRVGEPDSLVFTKMQCATSDSLDFCSQKCLGEQLDIWQEKEELNRQINA